MISGAIFPIGVIIYWVTNNLFTLGQQQWVLRKFPPLVPPKTGTAGKSTTGKTTAQPVKTGGLLGRKTVQPAAKAPAAAPKVAGPKPGAKPVNPKKGGGRPAKRQG